MPGPNTFSLSMLFQTVTACGVFFAISRVSPAAAIVLTLIVTPAIIRAALCAQQWRSALQSELTVGHRLQLFLVSLGFVMLISLAGTTVAMVVCTFFGIAAMAFEVAIGGYTTLSYDVFFLGATGGMLFGLGTGILAGMAIANQYWATGMPEEKRGSAPTDKWPPGS